MTASLITAVGPASAQQTTIAESGAWRGILSQDDGVTQCYALSAPTSRLPEGLNRDPGNLFVTVMAGGATEISIRFGFSVANAEHSLSIDGRTFPLVSQGETAWLRAQEDEATAVAAMRAGRELRVAAQSARGNATTDVYSLSGFTAALNAARGRCGS